VSYLLHTFDRRKTAIVGFGVDRYRPDLCPPDWSSRGGDNQRQLSLKEPSFLFREGDRQAFNQAARVSSDGCASSDPTDAPSHP
jgi:hypothetical protein